ncbi:MAG: HAD-IA family hydrolase [Promethearchaeota archaeon]
MEEVYESSNLDLLKKSLSDKDQLTTPLIKTIIFDLGGVVFTDGSILAIKKIKNALHLKKEDEKAIEECFSNDPGAMGQLIRLGLISLREFEEQFAKKLNLSKKKKKMIRHLWFSSYVPNFFMAKLLKQLSSKYRLVVFSGNVRERIEYMKKRYHKIFKYFDDAVYSFNYQKNKRDMTFYEDLLNHIDCAPEQAILIDDSINNIHRAKALGMDGIHYSYTEKLIKDFEKKGIKVHT